MGRKSGTILNEAMYQRVQKDRRKHYVVFNQGNQRKRTNTSRSNADLVLKNLKLKKLGQLHNDVLLTTDRRFRHYKANEGHIFLKVGLLLQKYYGEIGSSLSNSHTKAASRWRTPEIPQRIWRTSWNYQDKNCLQRKKLLAKNRSINEGVGYVIWAMA